jgi:hypothetical protein
MIELNRFLGIEIFLGIPNLLGKQYAIEASG